MAFFNRQAPRRPSQNSLLPSPGCPGRERRVLLGGRSMPRNGPGRGRGTDNENNAWRANHDEQSWQEPRRGRGGLTRRGTGAFPPRRGFRPPRHSRWGATVEKTKPSTEVNEKEGGEKQREKLSDAMEETVKDGQDTKPNVGAAESDKAAAHEEGQGAHMDKEENEKDREDVQERVEDQKEKRGEIRDRERVAEIEMGVKNEKTQQSVEKDESRLTSKQGPRIKRTQTIENREDGAEIEPKDYIEALSNPDLDPPPIDELVSEPAHRQAEERTIPRRGLLKRPAPGGESDRRQSVSSVQMATGQSMQKMTNNGKLFKQALLNPPREIKRKIQPPMIVNRQVVGEPVIDRSKNYSEFGVEKTATRYEVERLGQYEAGRLGQYQAERAVQYQAERAVPYEAERSVQYQAERSVPYQAERSVQYPAERSVPYPAKRSVQYPERSVPYPAKRSVQYPERSVQYPAERSVQYPERSVPYRSDNPTSYPANRPAPYQAERSGQPTSGRGIQYQAETSTRYPEARPIPYSTNRPVPYPTEKPVPYPPVDRSLQYPVKSPQFEAPVEREVGGRKVWDERGKGGLLDGAVAEAMKSTMNSLASSLPESKVIGEAVKRGVTEMLLHNNDFTAEIAKMCKEQMTKMLNKSLGAAEDAMRGVAARYDQEGPSKRIMPRGRDEERHSMDAYDKQSPPRMMWNEESDIRGQDGSRRVLIKPDNDGGGGIKYGYYEDGRRREKNMEYGSSYGHDNVSAKRGPSGYGRYGEDRRERSPLNRYERDGVGRMNEGQDTRNNWPGSSRIQDQAWSRAVNNRPVCGRGAPISGFGGTDSRWNDSRGQYKEADFRSQRSPLLDGRTRQQGRGTSSWTGW